MIKLETKAAALPQMVALFTLSSVGNTPGVALTTAGVREERNGEWHDSVSHVMQTVAGYMDGKPFALTGKVSHLDAVEIPAAFKVVLQVEVRTALSQAYEKGDRSKQIVTLSLSKVVEVWESAEKCLWRAKDGGNGHVLPPTVELGADRKAITREQLSAQARS